jgi:Holliday junction resolvasome RuvABC endonuclease subunit
VIVAKRRPQERIVFTGILTNSKTVLGLDCSTATIGWGLLTLENEPKLISFGHIKPMESKSGSLIERLNSTFNRITALCEQLSPDLVAVEEIKKFMKGMSSAQTITILAGFNRVISLAAYKISNNLKYYDESEVRKIIKNEYLRKSDKIGKEDMPDLIRRFLWNDFQGPLNTKGETAIETYDEADGVSVGWSCALDLRR